MSCIFNFDMIFSQLGKSWSCISMIALLVFFFEYQSYSIDISQMTATGCIIENGDTLPLIKIPAVYCFPKQKFKNHREAKKYWREYYRMVANVKKVYPFSLLAVKKLQEMEEQYVQIPSKKGKKEYLSKFEKDIMRNFKKPLMNLTFEQGRILIKLINKHTGRTTYSILKDVKGGFSAVFWQTISVIFQSNLKYQYESQGRDKMLHEIIILYEAGLL